ncbi:LysR family transcriptional regulator [Gottfriedia sp. NPDC057948]|uniref:LysR family transcriptional regulator n=1 Tax=Gottfriedia sp. NPDC057948 TaxID=3346287 RepID=UPI0036D9A1DC
MNIEKFEYLIEVAKTGSFSIASQNLFVSQPAISQSIKSIEKKLNVKIFERSRGNTVIPTVEGEKIIKFAKEIFLTYQELIDNAKLFNNNMTGNLKISAVPGFNKSLLGPFSVIKDEYPNINIDISQKPGHDIIEDIIEGRSDIGVLGLVNVLLEKNNRIIYRNLTEAKVKLMVSSKSHLAKKSFVTPQHILKETLIVYNGVFIQWFKNNFFNQFGAMKELYSTTNIDMIKNAVFENLGVSFVPDFKGANYNFNEDEVTLLDIVDYDEVDLQYVWIISRKNQDSKMIKDYLRILKKEFL